MTLTATNDETGLNWNTPSEDPGNDCPYCFGTGWLDAEAWGYETGKHGPPLPPERCSFCSAGAEK